MKQKIEELQQLASEVIGDGKRPELFFVTVEGVVITVTRSFEVAYAEWKDLPTNVESCLEARSTGVICDTSPKEEGSKQLRTCDGASWYTGVRNWDKAYKAY